MSEPKKTPPLVVVVNGVEHRIDMDEIEALHAGIQAGPGDNAGQKLAGALAGNPLASAAASLTPDPDSRGD